jgi:hypothetical protein
MTTIITRYYATAEAAAAATTQLAEEEMRMEFFDRFEGGATEDAIIRAGLYPSAAKAFAARLAKGGSLVVVRAPFGQTYFVKDILDAHGPIDSGVDCSEVYVESQPSNPQHHNKYLPVLLDSDTLIFSGSMMPAVARNWSFSKMLGMPLLSNKPAGRAKLLSDNPTPFSSALGLPLLIDKK